METDKNQSKSTGGNELPYPRTGILADDGDLVSLNGEPIPQQAVKDDTDESALAQKKKEILSNGNPIELTCNIYSLRTVYTTEKFKCKVSLAKEKQKTKFVLPEGENVFWNTTMSLKIGSFWKSDQLLLEVKCSKKEVATAVIPIKSLPRKMPLKSWISLDTTAKFLHSDKRQKPLELLASIWISKIDKDLEVLGGSSVNTKAVSSSKSDSKAFKAKNNSQKNVGNDLYEPNVPIVEVQEYAFLTFNEAIADALTYLKSKNDEYENLPPPDERDPTSKLWRDVVSDESDWSGETEDLQTIYGSNIIQEHYTDLENNTDSI